MKGLVQVFEKLASEKVSLENEILDRLQEQFTCDKATKDIAIKIKQLKETSRNAVRKTTFYIVVNIIQKIYNFRRLK